MQNQEYQVTKIYRNKYTVLPRNNIHDSNIMSLELFEFCQEYLELAIYVDPEEKETASPRHLFL